MPTKRSPPTMRALEDMERLHYRDQFRAARYAALADAEGFGEICFALEARGFDCLASRLTSVHTRSESGSTRRSRRSSTS